MIVMMMMIFFFLNYYHLCDFFTAELIALGSISFIHVVENLTLAKFLRYLKIKILTSRVSLFVPPRFRRLRWCRRPTAKRSRRSDRICSPRPRSWRQRSRGSPSWRRCSPRRSTSSSSRRSSSKMSRVRQSECKPCKINPSLIFRHLQRWFNFFFLISPIHFRAELQASDSRYQAQRRITQQLQTELLQLYSRVEMEAPASAATSSPPGGRADSHVYADSRSDLKSFLCFFLMDTC